MCVVVYPCQWKMAYYLPKQLESDSRRKDEKYTRWSHDNSTTEISCCELLGFITVVQIH